MTNPSMAAAGGGVGNVIVISSKEVHLLRRGLTVPVMGK